MMYRGPIVPDLDHHGMVAEVLYHLFSLCNRGPRHVLGPDYHHAILFLCRDLGHP
jgi:hypothetical protein